MAESLDLINIWDDVDFKQTNERGKLAMIYAIHKAEGNEEIIVEDMALATGLEISECANWLDLFVAKGKVIVIG